MKTRYPEIDIVHISGVNVCIGKKPIKDDFWRYLIEKSHVGPIMKSKQEALIGLDKYAREWGLDHELQSNLCICAVPHCVMCGKPVERNL